MDRLEITTTEMHTGGEPVRIVESGYPAILGDTILAKRRYVRDHLDHLRTFLMLEPRGHDDMYGVLKVEPDIEGAALAVLFMHNDGYSTMCGHATIALGRYAVEAGIVEPQSPTTEFMIQCPCGPVDLSVDVDMSGLVGSVRFRSVEAFVAALDVEVDVDGYGPISCDLAYGGAFYAAADAERFGLDVRSSPARDLVDAATALTAAMASHPSLAHPDHPDLGFLYGSILTDSAPATSTEPSMNICVFADGQVDRSPTGSGVTARMAIAAARHDVADLLSHTFEGVLGSQMTGKIVHRRVVGDRELVTVEVQGQAHFTGRAVFTDEPTDPLRRGFRLR